MKKFLLGLLGLAIAVYVLFVLFKPAAIAPNGELLQTPASGNITVTSPVAGAVVSGTIVVTGTERTFEQGVNWRLTDAQGAKWTEGFTTGHAPDVGQFGPYQFTITIPANTPKNLQIWVFQYSAKDGSIVDLVKVPVRLK